MQIKIDQTSVSDVKTIKQMQSYLGTVNFLCRFLNKSAEILKPLRDVIKKGNPDTIKWTPTLIEAFEKSKKALEGGKTSLTARANDGLVAKIVVPYQKADFRAEN